VPGNNVLPVKSSAIIQPTDQISTIIKNNKLCDINNLYKEYYKYCTLIFAVLYGLPYQNQDKNIKLMINFEIKCLYILIK